MPGGDGTGPMGLGSRTGRAAGFCAGNPVPGYLKSIPGRGFRGWGRGWRNRYYATGLPGWVRFGYAAPYPYGVTYPPQEETPQQEIEMLKGQAEYFEETLDGIRKRIAELEAAGAEKK